ncbi:MAG TPA: hypothetical protein VGD17_14745 [Chitinophagaceae bacterium]
MQFLLLILFWIWSSGFEPRITKNTTKIETLTIKLLSFKGKSDGQKNVLNWQTTSELDTREFIIEKSNDGKQFELTAWIRPKGNLHGPAFYSYTDETAGTTTYYRLRMVDSKGREQLSNVISISRSINKK